MINFSFSIEGHVEVTAGHQVLVSCTGPALTSGCQDKAIVEAFGAKNLAPHIPTNLRLWDMGSYEVPEAIEACGFGKDEIQTIIDDLKELL